MRLGSCDLHIFLGSLTLKSFLLQQLLHPHFLYLHLAHPLLITFEFGLYKANHSFTHHFLLLGLFLVHSSAFPVGSVPAGTSLSWLKLGTLHRAVSARRSRLVPTLWTLQRDDGSSAGVPQQKIPIQNNTGRACTW